MKNFFRKTNTNSGFTIIETLVSLSIFSMSIITLLSVLGNGISSTNYAKQKMIASYLAQEGIEYTRNIRDTFVLYSASSQEGWDDFKEKLTDAGCDLTDGCFFDDHSVFSGGEMPSANHVSFIACGTACPKFLYDETTGKYNYISGTSTNLTRKIKITEITDDEMKVSSTVYWVSGTGTKSLTLSEDLFNWIE
jgi:Tfp pilus assembly protein PilV